MQQKAPEEIAPWKLGDTAKLRAFLMDTKFSDLPEGVVVRAQRCILDLIGVAAVGSRTEVAAITARHASEHMGSASKSSRLLFARGIASLAGASFVGATTIDSFDGHDGHPLTKGHIGVTVLPVLLALAEAGRVKDGRELIASLVLGYEIGTRAGIVLHETTHEHHTSGAWGAIAAAALVSRHLKLSWAKTREALGTAEYYGPRSQMMRCIQYPTMVKDGSGWGAFAGVTAALLAADGYTGAPAVTLEDRTVSEFWGDLGERWRIMEQYFKPYGVCRWAQPAMEAARAILAKNRVAARDIEQIEVRSFHNAVALNTRKPACTDSAQYSLPFPVAALMVHGRLGASELTGSALQDKEVLRLTSSMLLRESPEFSAKFPAERWAQVSLRLKDGRRLESPPCVARGSMENPLSDAEVEEKYTDLARPVLGKTRTEAIKAEVKALTEAKRPLRPLLDLVLAAPRGR